MAQESRTMTEVKLSPEDQKRRDHFKRTFKIRMALKPNMSDKEFMDKTEVSDKQYELGITLPGVNKL